MSKRLQQINELLRHELGIIINELSQPEWGITTITYVTASPDLQQAKVWIAGEKKAVDELNKKNNETLRRCLS